MDTDKGYRTMFDLKESFYRKAYSKDYRGYGFFKYKGRFLESDIFYNFFNYKKYD